MALRTYYPEMKDQKPATDFEASLSHYGRHYFVQSSKEIAGRGITFVRTITAADLVPQAQHKVGRHEYKVTTAAFKTLCAAHDVAVEALL